MTAIDHGPAPSAGYLTGRRAVATATAIATLAHYGQLDQGDRAYIEHPRRVAGYLLDATWEELVVAWLHDVVEDTDVTIDAICQSFGPVIADAVAAISRRPHEPGDDYYARVKANPLARKVKVYGDLRDNLDVERLAVLPEAKRTRLIAKYTHALEVLVEGDPAGQSYAQDLLAGVHARFGCVSWPAL